MTKHLPKLSALLLVFGAVLRIVGTGAAALWYDESVVLYRATIPFMTLFSNQTDSSGDLFLDLIERPLMAISHSLWMLRLPSLVASLIGLWLVWKLMQNLEFNFTQRVCTAAFVSVLPGLLWIAQDARSYSLVAMFGLAALWFALSGGLLGLVACLGLMAYCHTTAVVYAGALLVITLVLTKDWKRTLVTGLVVTGAWAPALVRILFSNGASGVIQPWAPFLTLEWLERSGMIALWTHQAGSLLAFLAMMLTLPLLFSNITNRGRIVALLAWGLPVAGLIVLSLGWKNIILYRILMPYLFPFGLWLGWECGHRNPPPEEETVRDGLAKVLTLFWTCLLLASLLLWRPAARGAGLDLVAAQIRSEWQAGDVIVYATKTVQRPFLYYLSDKPYALMQVVQSPFLMEPGLLILNTGNPATAKRLWLVIPADPCMTAAEHAQIDALYPHGDPLMRLVYLQAAPINVYLEKR